MNLKQISSIAHAGVFDRRLRVSEITHEQAKHLAFARCGELNLYNVVEAQVATVESELFADVL